MDRPRNAIDCKKCKGRPPRRGQPVCATCRGRGWLTPAELEAMKSPAQEVR